ncbi:GNAT family N-acetyltransferase [Fibrella forsythiae]|uniref:GNAT family N-acetyltransferase n=1 Tax=Fibrella forsythiae TaxID=2817061 RepID=A0ABS3JM12_9BACT|nr:GNAT family N-acetyltransferase [Fibrella forsythiae]MBO0951034.1 GNAT family N-acetyltransferase [Fibrella forsythiae]
MNEVTNFRIDPVLSQQAIDLSELCFRIYPQHFTYLWDDDGAWYQAHSYGASQLKAELDHPNVRYFWAIVNDQRVGYLKINLSKPLPQTQEPGGLEIERIYFLAEAAGQGLGTLLIEFAETIARQRQATYMWLHVMDSSRDSIAFYEKRGFNRVGETRLPFPQLKAEYRSMWQMKKVML